MNHLPFAISEYESRLERVQQSMDRNELDAIVITAPPNFRYFSGLDTQFWESPARPWFLILPRSGSSIAVVPGIAEVTIKRSFAGEIHTWASPAPQDEGVSLLSSVLKNLPRTHGRIGFELGRESVIRMPFLDFLRVRENLSGIDLVDGSMCIWEVRNIKSQAEIEKIRTSCQAVSRAFANAPSFLHAGMTERDACRELNIEILKQGAQTIPYTSCGSGPGGYEEIISRGSNRVIGDGDVLMIDIGATVDGYFCDFDRNYAFGRVDDAAHAAHRTVWEATEAGIQAARPGVKVADLWRIMMDVLQAGGMLGNNAGRLGHGLGLQLTEIPSHSQDDEAVLQPGMVITIEPGMEYAPGKMIVHEENIAITDGEADLLTVRAPQEMWAIN